MRTLTTRSRSLIAAQVAAIALVAKIVKQSASRGAAFCLPLLVAFGLLLLIGGAANAQAVTYPDYSTLITSGQGYSSNLVTTYGGGLILIALTFAGFGWVFYKIVGVFRH